MAHSRPEKAFVRIFSPSFSAIVGDHKLYNQLPDG